MLGPEDQKNDRWPGGKNDLCSGACPHCGGTAASPVPAKPRSPPHLLLPLLLSAGPYGGCRLLAGRRGQGGPAFQKTTV